MKRMDHEKGHKRSSRSVGLLLALLMLVSVAMPVMEASAEEGVTELDTMTAELDGVVTAAATTVHIDNQNLAQGGSVTIRNNVTRLTSYTVKNASGDDVTNTAGIGVSRSNNALSLTADYSTEAGTYTVTVTWTEPQGRNGTVTCTATFKVTVTASTDIVDGKVKVYVYVGTKAGTDSSGKPIYWYDNEEFLELLGISKDTVDANGYFPVGEIYLDSSYFSGKEQAAASVGAPLINSAEDWATLLEALSELNTTTLTGKYAANQNNKVGEYLS